MGMWHSLCEDGDVTAEAADGERDVPGRRPWVYIKWHWKPAFRELNHCLSVSASPEVCPSRQRAQKARAVLALDIGTQDANSAGF